MSRAVTLAAALCLLSAGSSSVGAVDGVDIELDDAVTLHAIGKEDAAYAAFNAVLEEAVHVFGHEDYDAAEKLLRAWIAHFEQLEDEAPANIAFPRSYLARTLARLGDLSGALEMASRIVDEFDFDLHEHSDQRAVTMLNAGAVFVEAREFAMAELTLERAVHIVQEMPSSPATLHMAALAQLRSLRASQGRVDEARSIGTIRMAQLQSRSGQNPELASAFAILKSAHELRQARGTDFREVARRMARSVEILANYLGADDPELLMIRLEQGQALLVERDSITTGRHLIVEVLEALEHDPILNRLHIARALDVLGISYAQQNEYASAQRYFEQSLALYGEEGPDATAASAGVRQNLCQVIALTGVTHPLCP